MGDGYLAEWLRALEGPQNPPFKKDETFAGESNVFFGCLLHRRLLRHLS